MQFLPGIFCRVVQQAGLRILDPAMMVRTHLRQPTLEDEPDQRAGTALKADRAGNGLGSMPSVFRQFPPVVQFAGLPVDVRGIGVQILAGGPVSDTSALTEALSLVPVSDASNNSMFACLSSRSERGQHPSRPPIFKPAKTKQPSRVSLTDEEAGASPVAGASFLGHEEERLIRLPWEQEKPGALPGCPTISTKRQ